MLPEHERVAELRYAPCYCEENVWQLCHEAQVRQDTASRLVLFISNQRRACALWAQRACRRRHEPVVWDYHVALLAGGSVVSRQAILAALPGVVRGKPELIELNRQALEAGMEAFAVV